MSKHTPGPWNIGYDDGSGIAGGRQETTCITAESKEDYLPHVICECRRTGAAFDSLPVNYNASLIAAAPDMYEALESVLVLLRWRGEGPLEAVERMCEQFYRDTGMMAPGKSVAAAANSHSEEERLKEWEQWALVKVDKARVTLAKARGET